MNSNRWLLLLGITSALLTAAAADAKLVLVAGKPSHGPGDHEFNAGCLLLKKCLSGVPGLEVTVGQGGWPNTVQAIGGATT
jgi:hypothetical protein